MSKRQLIILLGALIILLALIAGFPSPWNSALNVILGVLIIFVAYTTKPSSAAAKKDRSAPYVDAHGEARPDAAAPKEPRKEALSAPQGEASAIPPESK